MYKKSILIVLLMLSAMLSACNFPLAFDDTAEVENAVAEVVEELEEAEVVVPTLALAATSTVMPTEEPEDADEADEAEEVEEAEPTKPPCLSAQAWDLTIPDDTKVVAGAKFDKAWTFKNVGYCTWDSDYKIVFDDGDQMSGPNFKEIGVEVDPNGKLEVLVVLYAPATAGTYRGDWILQSADGIDFGPVWVQIVVE